MFFLTDVGASWATVHPASASLAFISRSVAFAATSAANVGDSVESARVAALPWSAARVDVIGVAAVRLEVDEVRLARVSERSVLLLSRTFGE